MPRFLRTAPAAVFREEPIASSAHPSRPPVVDALRYAPNLVLMGDTPAGPDWDALAVLIQKGDEAAFDALYQKDPHAFAGAVAVYQSESLQHASPSAPRLISFANDGSDKTPASSSLVVTVAPLDGDDGRLEALAYDQDAGRFTFAEISFARAGDGQRHPRVERDPPRCGACAARAPGSAWRPIPTSNMSAATGADASLASSRSSAWVP